MDCKFVMFRDNYEVKVNHESADGESSSEYLNKSPGLFIRLLGLFRVSRGNSGDETWKYNYTTVGGQEDLEIRKDDSDDDTAILRRLVTSTIAF